MLTIGIYQGPPFTHPSIPYRAHYIGSTSPRSSPSQYLSAIQALLEAYRLDIQPGVIDNVDTSDDRISDVIPLVVNSMGWTKGLGADLNRKIEEMLGATDVFEVETPLDTGWPSLAPTVPQTYDPTSSHNARSHVLEPIPTSVLTKNYSPADHRTLSILSYFHAIFPPAPSKELQQISATAWNTSLPLCAQYPYEVDWTLALDKVVLTGAGSEDVVSSEIRRVLNGAVVGLVSCEPFTADGDTDMSTAEQATAVPYTQGSSVPSPSTSTCHGLALIRSISPTSSHMHVLTPAPSYVLHKCRIIVKGELELPIWGMLDFRTDNEYIAGVEKSKVPYLQWGKGEGIGSERKRVRRNLMRRGQM
jgi:polynucleotide 5'-hydroxyl-kinase GRC3/NOL9